MLYYHLHDPNMNKICVMEPGLTIIDVHQGQVACALKVHRKIHAVKSALRTNDLVQEQRYDEVVTEGQHATLPMEEIEGSKQHCTSPEPHPSHTILLLRTASCLHGELKPR